MHPPKFRLARDLSGWPECFIEAQCSTRKRRTVTPTQASHAAPRRHADNQSREAHAMLEVPRARPGAVISAPHTTGNSATAPIQVGRLSWCQSRGAR
jgi:hypothetical protein